MRETETPPELPIPPPDKGQPRRAPAPSAKSLNCPSCGGPLTIRAPGHSVSVACGSCGAVLDAQDPDFKIIEKHALKPRVQPRLPLGVRGKVRGETYEVVGFLIRTSEADGVPFSWNEYLLFNPYLGFRWLTEYEGHWIIAKEASGSPVRLGTDVQYLGEKYRHFQTAKASVAYVMGEFPWRVKTGETAVVEDFISPPRVLSCERTENEINWSVGEHVEGEDVWKAFGLEGSPPPRHGVGGVQPSPFGPHARNVVMLLIGFIGMAFAVQTFFMFFSQNRMVYENRFAYNQADREKTRVTDSFDLTGRRSNVRIDIDTDVANNWAHFNMALINEGTGNALNFGREVSYYFGRDSDGSWSEGGKKDKVYLPSVESGRYYLLVEPETAAAKVNYSVRVRRDVPRMSYVLWAIGLLAVPPLIFCYRRRNFEYKRWLESDHPMMSLKDLKESGDED
ncbi:MAG: DUF4178 domain-containing protein [Nitrospirae bacterium]|nr:DUF4178 domain-containing protein [Nitrospirota bacterium]